MSADNFNEGQNQELQLNLFPDWQGQITLPPSPVKRETIGKNSLLQQAFRGMQTTASASKADGGYYLLKTSLAYPFSELLLRIKGTRRIECTTHLVLSAYDIKSVNEIGLDTRLEWDNTYLLEKDFSRPEQVLENWKGKFTFREEDEDGLKGLRQPQIGALHALSAHFSTGINFEPATIVLPTGTGKTETMLSFQVYRRLRRTLVIVPSNVLREQISDKFINLGVLPDAGVIPQETIGPNVVKLKAGIHSEEEARNIIEKTNVIVALPKTLSESTPEALNVLIEGCTDLIIDEAHHVPASQWSKVRQMFDRKRIIQFTATPFRRDEKRIDGKIIFNYKLGDAQAAGYYRTINLKTIEEYGEIEKRDYKIAEEALSVLRRDRNDLNLDHILMARCESKERAQKVFKIYQELAPDMFPQLIYSGSGRIRENRNAVAKLKNRREGCANIVVCVDMLGEGFDLPNLKIAALHDTHKSLAITLQFIGRFTRKGNWQKVGNATVVANIADSETETKLESLYAEGADWDALIQRLSEDTIDQEIRLQDIVNSLKDGGDLHTYISLWNLRPTLSTQIFKTQCSNWNPKDYISVLPKDSKSWSSISEDNAVMVAVVFRNTRVRWGNYQDLLDGQYHLILARWDKGLGALFIFSSDYEGLKSVEMAKAITDEKTELLTGPVIFNILNNVEIPLVKNLGTSRIGAISFTSYFGPNVTEGLAQIERSESELNNIACVGYENGDRVLWGGTQKRGKVWQQSSGTIAQWIDWTSRTWEKVSKEEDLNISNIAKEFLRPNKLDLPYKEYPISVQWGEQAQIVFNDHQFISFGAVEVPIYMVNLQISEVKEDGEIVILISSDNISSEYSFLIDANLQDGYAYKRISGPEIFFIKRSDKIELSNYFKRDPLIVRYADGTYSYNCYHIPVPMNTGEYPKDLLEVWDWSSIPLNKESMGKTRSTNTIQYNSFLQISNDFDVVFNDDGSGEAGDLVCLRDIDESTIKLCLVHCKGAYKGKVSNDIRNFYFVCGQAQKSITIKHMGITNLYKTLKSREAFWEKEGYSRFLKGDMKLLSYFKDRSRRSKLQFEVIIVQPGGSKATISSDILKLLGTTELFIKTTTQGNFRVVVSP